MLDTDVLVAAFRSDAGASRILLRHARSRRFTLLLSVPLVLEYESVLTRPEHLIASGASAEDVKAVLDELTSLAKRVELAVRLRPTLSDPNDEMVLETAVNGSADAIIAFNKRHFETVASRFGCKVMRPADAVQVLRKASERE